MLFLTTQIQLPLYVTLLDKHRRPATREPTFIHRRSSSPIDLTFSSPRDLDKCFITQHASAFHASPTWPTSPSSIRPIRPTRPPLLSASEGAPEPPTVGCVQLLDSAQPGRRDHAVETMLAAAEAQGRLTPRQAPAARSPEALGAADDQTDATHCGRHLPDAENEVCSKAIRRMRHVHYCSRNTTPGLAHNA